MKLPFTLCLSVFLAIAGLWPVSGAAETFQDGETVVFLGDSITHGRRFHSFIYDFYLTRYPERKIHFVNAGVAGDSAGGAMRRLEDDVISKSPTAVVVMLGMNDVGRSNYVANPTEQQLEAQAGALARYETNMDALLAKVKSETEARLILLTPSPFDQTATIERENQPGCNDGLAKCADLFRKLAEKYQAEVIDLHGPMTEFNLDQQKDDPTYTIVGFDRVHPGIPGNLMMAWLFLKAQNVDPVISSMEFDAREGRAYKTSNVSVTDSAGSLGTWNFNVEEEAIPWPINALAEEILPLIPEIEDLNRQIVRFKNLPDGKYTLTIDEEEVASHTAEEWAEGINIASIPTTPQAKQAAEVAKLNEERRLAETRLRGYACVRWFLGRYIDPDDFDAVREFMKSKEGETGYYLAKVPTYLAEWEDRAEVQAEVLRLEKKAREAAQPKKHEFKIAPAGE